MVQVGQVGTQSNIITAPTIPKVGSVETVPTILSSTALLICDVFGTFHRDTIASINMVKARLSRPLFISLTHRTVPGGGMEHDTILLLHKTVPGGGMEHDTILLLHRTVPGGGMDHDTHHTPFTLPVGENKNCVGEA